MTNKEIILDCLNQDDEALTQIVEYFELPPKINISHSEIKKLLSELIDDGYVTINYKWKTEHDEYHYSLTEKGKKAWAEINNKNY